MSPEEMDLMPRPEHRFTFGLWTVGNPGRDPFGEPTRPPLDPVTSVERLAELGAYGVSLHDNDLVPYGASAAERDRIVARFSAALEPTGMRVTMATTNLFGHPAFKDGAFTSNDRARAARGDRQGDARASISGPSSAPRPTSSGVDARVPRPRRPSESATRSSATARRSTSSAATSATRATSLRFAIEPKPNEPRGDIFLPTVGHALHFITTLDHPDMVGVNPEVAHETMAGLSFVHAVSQALWAGKLFHIDLNGQRIGRYDQDFRFGAEDLKEAFLLVHLLETSGYDGVRHFDAHAYRSEDPEGVWEFAAGCMRTYLALAAKSRQFLASDAIREAREAARVDELAEPSVGPYSPEAASALLGEDTDLDPLAAHGYGNERLDQLVVELLLGADG